MAVLGPVTVTSMANMIATLRTFLVTTTGEWTDDRHVPASGEWAVSKTPGGQDISFASQWDTASPDFLGLYQYLGTYNTGNAPYAQTDDSGNGALSTTDSSLLADRSAEISDTPLRLWCFEDDDYFHAVVEISSGVFSHFGAGTLNPKYGDWTGGEYVYGCRQQGTFSSDTATQGGSTTLLDGYTVNAGAPTPGNMELFAATIHCESLPGGPTSHKYAVNMGAQASGNLGNDRQGTPRGRAHFTHGFRSGPLAENFARFSGSDLSGHVPMYPIVVTYYRRDNDNVYGPMGVMPDVRGIQMANYIGGQQITLGGDTWTVFPSREKYVTGGHTGRSELQGIAYKHKT